MQAARTSSQQFVGWHRRRTATLQYVVMGFVSAVLGKDRVGDPWKNSHHRWTELPIEMWFGRLRQRATSAQFNAKQYWSHAAAEMMRTKKLGVGESDSSILQPPTEEEFYTASQRALNSALKLAAWTAEVSEETLFGCLCRVRSKHDPRI